MGSLAGSGFQELGGNFAKSAAGTIGFSAVAGGVGAELTGGEFWKGATTGAIVAGLNHLHNSIQKQQQNKFFDRLREHYESNTGDDFILTKKEVNYLTSKGKINPATAKLIAKNTYSVTIDFYDADFDLKYSFGKSTAAYTISNNGKQISITGFFDVYDFDPKAWGVRSYTNELITRGYNIYSSGTPFNIIYGKTR